MTKRHASACLLAVAVAATAIIGALTLTPQDAEASTVTVKTCGGDAIELNAAEKRILALHNTARIHRGLKALCVEPVLTKAARAHTQEMLDKDYISHNSFNGETVEERLIRFDYTSSGYSYYLVGENIAWACGSSMDANDIFRWWMNSLPHRSNILNKDFRQIGIGIRSGTYKTCSQQARVYTVDFGTRRR